MRGKKGWVHVEGAQKKRSLETKTEIGKVIEGNVQMGNG